MVFRNRIATFLWLFTAAWLSVLLAMTWVFVRSGPPAGMPQPAMAAVLAVFWLAGLGLVASAATKPRITVDVGERTARVTHRYPHRKAVRTFTSAQLTPAMTVKTQDSDGDPYFVARATASDGTRIDLHEGHVEAACDEACARFNAAIFGR